MPTQLLAFDAAIKAVALAKTVPEAKVWRDKAEAVIHWAKRAKNKKILQDAIEIKMEAERKSGRLLIDMDQSGQRQKSGQAGGKLKIDGRTRRPSIPKLSDLGVNKTESSRWQSFARLPAVEWSSKKRHVKGVAVATLEGSKEVIAAARAESLATKKAKRRRRERELAAKLMALPEKRYGVIYADPEWKFETYSEDGLDRSAANHYPLSNLQEIIDRDVPSIAADDCALFLWATVPMLRQALHVMAAWGFEYKSQVAWIKNQAGNGYWFRNQHELLLLGTRGQIPAPSQGEQWSSVIHAARGKHSEKPVEAYELIEAYFPNLPKIELNARNTRKGWDAWGNEVAEAADDLSTGAHSSQPRRSVPEVGTGAYQAGEP